MRKIVASWCVACVCLVGCGNSEKKSSYQYFEEVGNSAADVLSSLGEASQQDGLARAPILNRPDLQNRTPWERGLNLILPSAWAGLSYCTAANTAFSACQDNHRVREFNDCLWGPVVLNGSVDLAFNNAQCALDNAGDSVTRTANYVLSAKRGSFQVSSPQGGQTLTRTVLGLVLSVGGVERVLKNDQGEVVMDVVTRTLEDLTITGEPRGQRIVANGQLEIKHLVAGYTVVVGPENLVWNSTCYCPISGKLVGMMTHDQEQKSAAIEFAGCGTGKVTIGDQITEVTFDRCGSL